MIEFGSVLKVMMDNEINKQNNLETKYDRNLEVDNAVVGNRMQEEWRTMGRDGRVRDSRPDDCQAVSGYLEIAPMETRSGHSYLQEGYPNHMKNRERARSAEPPDRQTGGPCPVEYCHSSNKASSVVPDLSLIIYKTLYIFPVTKISCPDL